jgi:hypothetical protein
MEHAGARAVSRRLRQTCPEFRPATGIVVTRLLDPCLQSIDREQMTAAYAAYHSQCTTTPFLILHEVKATSEHPQSLQSV